MTDKKLLQMVILAAGKGTRMNSDIPKMLVPLGDKPVISHLLSNLKTLFEQYPPVVVVGFQSEVVKTALGDKFTYALQKEQNGTGDAVACAKDKISADNILVLYGDVPFITATSIEELARVHTNNKAKVSMFTCKVPNFEEDHTDFLAFGRIIRDDKGNITRIVEYKDATDEEKEVTEVNPGIYMFNTEWLWHNMGLIQSDNAQGEYYLTDIIEIAMRDGQEIFSLPIAAEEVYGINTQEHLLHAKQTLTSAEETKKN